jgi:hypothetical protein
MYLCERFEQKTAVHKKAGALNAPAFSFGMIISLLQLLDQFLKE